LNINRAFQCENILNCLSTTTDSQQKRELWEQLRIECFARLFTLAYCSSFILALTELVVSALSGRLYSQAQNQQIRTTAGAVSATAKSSHAEVKPRLISCWCLTSRFFFVFSRFKNKIVYSRETFN